MSLPLRVIEHHPYPKYLIPIGFIVFFAIAVTLILFLIFPGRLLYVFTMQQEEADPIALFYLNKLNSRYPDNVNLQVAYIHQQISLNKLKEAETSIVLLEKNRSARDLAQTLKFDYLVIQIDQLKKNKKMTAQKELAQKELALKDQVNQLLKLQFPKEMWMKLANMALRYNHPDHALLFYLKTDQLGSHHTISWYITIASTALQSSHYQIAADYYLKAAEIAPAVTTKRVYIKEALLSLQSGQLGKQGLDIAAKLPAPIMNDVDFLFFLSEYAITANQPNIAATYVQKAISLEGESQ